MREPRSKKNIYGQIKELKKEINDEKTLQILNDMEQALERYYEAAPEERIKPGIDTYRYRLDERLKALQNEEQKMATKEQKSKEKDAMTPEMAAHRKIIQIMDLYPEKVLAQAEGHLPKDDERKAKEDTRRTAEYGEKVTEILQILYASIKGRTWNPSTSPFKFVRETAKGVKQGSKSEDMTLAGKAGSRILSRMEVEAKEALLSGDPSKHKTALNNIMGIISREATDKMDWVGDEYIREGKSVASAAGDGRRYGVYQAILDLKTMRNIELSDTAVQTFKDGLQQATGDTPEVMERRLDGVKEETKKQASERDEKSSLDRRLSS